MKKVMVVLAAAGMIAGLYAVSPYRAAKTPEKISLVQPRVCAIRDTVTLHGSIADPARKRIYAEGISVVKKVYVTQGEMVQQGQLLMRLEKVSDPQGEQAAAAAALGQLRDTLENGELAEAESMLEGIIGSYGTAETPSSATIYDLVSPVSGMVMRLSAKEGEQVHRLLPCVEISDLSQLVIQAEAGEEVIGILQEDMECSVAVPAFQLSGLSGKITQILPYAQQTGRFTGNLTTQTTVCVAVEDPGESLRPGYRATVQVLTGYRENVLVIPYETIAQDENGREYVLVVRGGRAAKQLIVTKAELGNGAEVSSGITASDFLVVRPDSIQEGARIQLVS